MLKALPEVLLKRLVEKHGRPPSPARVASEIIGGDLKVATPPNKHSDGVPQWTNKVVALDGVNTRVLTKAIMQKMSGILTEVCLDTIGSYADGDSTRGLAIVYDEAVATLLAGNQQTDNKSGGDTGKGKRFELQRFRLSDQTTAAGLELPYWGKVVGAKVAVTMSNNFCLPLGDNKGRGPALFVEGASVANLLRSDGCFAWNIAPLPQNKSRSC